MDNEHIHSKYPEPCDNCGSAASSNTDINVHSMKSPTGPCDNSGNTAKSNQYIGVHIENIHSEYPEPCDNCGNAAFNNTDTKVHSTNIHSEPRDPCDNSGSNSSANIDIKVHSINTHSEVAASCDKCGDAETCNCDLQVHSNLSDNTSNSLSNPNVHVKLTHGKKCRCTKCQVNFKSNSHIIDHIIPEPKVSREAIWKNYNTEFTDLVIPLQEELENSNSNPTEVASLFTNLLTDFLSSKPNILKEVKTFFKQKPYAMTNLNSALKLKTED